MNSQEYNLFTAVAEAKALIGPPPYKVSAFSPVVYWDEATEEEQNDPSLIWFRDPAEPHRVMRFRGRTEEEQEQAKLNEEWEVQEIFKYIFEHYGWQMAESYYDTLAPVRQKLINVNIKKPHCMCNFEEVGQCDMFCDFYLKGECGHQP